jgi:CelD/BcsL family acetyltransferase involved in cellulose biosynthesis
MPDAELIANLDALAPLSGGWDALAVECGRPHVAPAWVLGWWRHLAPRNAEPRVVAVRDGDELIGLAPFFVDHSRRGRLDYRLSGIELSAGLSPLARPGREWEVAAGIGEALATATPRPDLIALEGFPADSPWLLALRDGWPEPARPQARLYQTYGSPLLTLREPSFEAWLAGKSANFRGQMRRLRRHVADAGGVLRTATHETLADDIATFLRLHAERWESLGESNLVAMGETLPPMLDEVGRALLDEDRFQLSVLEVDGEPAGAQLFMSAGEQVMYVNGGFSERYAKLKPSMLGLLERIESAFARGERCLDLGLGEQPYKLRFANGNAPVAWGILMAPGRRLPLTYARTVPMLARYTLRDVAKRRLKEEQIDGLRTLRRRLLP